MFNLIEAPLITTQFKSVTFVDHMRYTLLGDPRQPVPIIKRDGRLYIRRPSFSNWLYDQFNGTQALKQICKALNAVPLKHKIVEHRSRFLPHSFQSLEDCEQAARSMGLVGPLDMKCHDVSPIRNLIFGEAA